VLVLPATTGEKKSRCPLRQALLLAKKEELTVKPDAIVRGHGDWRRSVQGMKAIPVFTCAVCAGGDRRRLEG